MPFSSAFSPSKFGRRSWKLWSATTTHLNGSPCRLQQSMTIYMRTPLSLSPPTMAVWPQHKSVVITVVSIRWMSQKGSNHHSELVPTSVKHMAPVFPRRLFNMDAIDTITLQFLGRQYITQSKADYILYTTTTLEIFTHCATKTSNEWGCTQRIHSECTVHFCYNYCAMSSCYLSPWPVLPGQQVVVYYYIIVMCQ